MLDAFENDPTPLMLNGHSLVIPVIGYPIKQVRSPRPLSLKLQALGLNAIQVPMLISPDALPGVLTSLKQIGNVAGFVVTVPHKVDAVSHVDHLTARAQAAGSINAMRREADGSWTGDNLDGEGFMAGLRAAGHDVAGKSVLIVGLGGAGASLAASLAQAEAAQLELFDLDPARCEAAAERLKLHFPQVRTVVVSQPRSDTADLAINATHLGMHEGDALPFDPALLKPEAVVADVIMNPAETELLRLAAAQGRQVVMGENILFYQLDLLPQFFMEPNR